jgi:hypothetical protein
LREQMVDLIRTPFPVLNDDPDKPESSFHTQSLLKSCADELSMSVWLSYLGGGAYSQSIILLLAFTVMV